MLKCLNRQVPRSSARSSPQPNPTNVNPMGESEKSLCTMPYDACFRKCLDEERGEEGPPDEVCLGKDEKVTDDEEEQERDVGEGGEGNEEQKETEMLPGEERGEDAEMLKGYDVQETSIDISQVASTGTVLTR